MTAAPNPIVGYQVELRTPCCSRKVPKAEIHQRAHTIRRRCPRCHAIWRLKVTPAGPHGHDALLDWARLGRFAKGVKADG